MDALHLIPAHGCPDYARQRPRLAVPPPGEPEGALELDGTFGFHPALAPAWDLYRDGQLAVVQACGTPDQTLSHFEAGRTLERGVSDGRTTATGWLSRHLLTAPTGQVSPLRAVAFAQGRPAVLAGAPGTTVLRSLAKIRLDAPPQWGPGFVSALSGLYGEGTDAAVRAGQHTLRLVRDLGRLGGSAYTPSGGAAYPRGKLGGDLKQVAQLLKAEIGLEAAVIEHDGWDSHVN